MSNSSRQKSGSGFTEWQNNEELRQLLMRGPKEIQSWRNQQIEELEIPHLSSQQLPQIASELNIPLSSFYRRIYTGMLEQFLSTIRQKDASQPLERETLLNILRHSFQFIEIPEFESINVEILTRLRPLPNEVIKTLCERPQILQRMPLVVKRNVWQTNSHLFDEQIDHCCKEYCEQFEPLFTQTLETPTQSPKLRRMNNSALKQLVSLIGPSAKLLRNVHRRLGFVFRKRMKEFGQKRGLTKDLLGLAQFRMDVTLSLFECAHEKLAQTDECWKFLKWADYIINRPNTPNIDIEALRSFLSTINQNTMSDFGLLCILPSIRSVLLLSYFQTTEKIANRNILPRHSRNLEMCTQLLQLSVANNKFDSLPVANPSLIVHFAPYFIASVCSDIALRQLSKYISDSSKKDDFISVETGVGYLDPLTLSNVDNSAMSVPIVVLLMYLLQCTKSQQFHRCKQIISVLNPISAPLFTPFVNEIHSLCVCIVKNQIAISAYQTLMKILIEFVISKCSHLNNGRKCALQLLLQLTVEKESNILHYTKTLCHSDIAKLQTKGVLPSFNELQNKYPRLSTIASARK